MLLPEHVVDRLLLAKHLLKHRAVEAGNTVDSHTIAAQIIASHDAAELACAAVADQLGCQLSGGPQYLQNYVAAIFDKGFPISRDFFKLLNAARNEIKHMGMHPNPAQFRHVVSNTYRHLSDVCKSALDVNLDDIDESSLIADD